MWLPKQDINNDDSMVDMLRREGESSGGLTHRQLRAVGVGKNGNSGLPLGRTTQLLLQCQVVSSKIIYMQVALDILRRMYLRVCV